MIKQIHHEASEGQDNGATYTLIHVSRTHGELGYYSDFVEIEKSGKMDFLYIPAVSRPTPADSDRAWLVRAERIIYSGLSRYAAQGSGRQRNKTQHRDSRARRSAPTAETETGKVRTRLNPEGMVLMSCGNRHFLEDMQYIATKNHIRFEREDW